MTVCVCLFLVVFVLFVVYPFFILFVVGRGGVVGELHAHIHLGSRMPTTVSGLRSRYICLSVCMLIGSIEGCGVFIVLFVLFFVLFSFSVVASLLLFCFVFGSLLLLFLCLLCLFVCLFWGFCWGFLWVCVFCFFCCWGFLGGNISYEYFIKDRF